MGVERFRQGPFECTHESSTIRVLEHGEFGVQEALSTCNVEPHIYPIFCRTITTLMTRDIILLEPGMHGLKCLVRRLDKFVHLVGGQVLAVVFMVGVRDYT